MKLASRTLRPVSRPGTTTVEFAIVVPVLFLILLGSIEFARANQVANAVAYSAYRGCRQAIVPGGSATGVTSAANQALAGNVIAGGTVSISPTTISDSTSTVSVTVSVPMSNVGWIFPKFFGSKTISRTCTLTRERTS